MSYSAKAFITINAPASKVWEALTTPELIKDYLFGTEVESTWVVGSPITYRGIWAGKEYEDKGTILEIQPNKILKSTYWSSIGGKEDKPENYNTVTYILSEESDQTTLTITQDNNASEEAAQESEGNWNVVLEGIKKLVESK